MQNPIRYRRAFDRYSFEKHRIDALVMESLTSSPYVADIYGFCGESVANEFGYKSGGQLVKTALSPSEKLKFATQAANGVADLHNMTLYDNGSNDVPSRDKKRSDHLATLAHLDIKTENFIVTKENVMKVHDFNLARFLEINTETREPCRFKRNDCNIWRSPEECSKSPTVSEKSDVYALGGVFFNILTLHRPFFYDKKTKTQGKGKFPTIPQKFTDKEKRSPPEYAVLVDAIQRIFVSKPEKRPSARTIANFLISASQKLKSDRL
uniref:Protein kinase domain-containing protein n=1 Tax=Corethron hystrix TaxID=216773 RepID=A0A6U5F9V0_9STRA|mmetsp:Transcript_21975/g.50095  ORF Transcript_21975/g.50095 Transcript_21975/m.50095 type:complete len:266 (+) Transcript_21975:446-1243(+)